MVIDAYCWVITSVPYKLLKVLFQIWHLLDKFGPSVGISLELLSPKLSKNLCLCRIARMSKVFKMQIMIKGSIPSKNKVPKLDILACFKIKYDL